MNLDYWKRSWFKAFGDYIYPDTFHTNALYGGKKIGNYTSHIFFTNGGDDPWQGASITDKNDVCL